MMTSTVYGLRPPEKQVDLDLEKVNRPEILENTYDLWLTVIGWNLPGRRHPVLLVPMMDPVYEKACSMVKPFAKRITGKLTLDDFRFFEKYRHDTDSLTHKNNLNWLFASAVLNSTDADSMEIYELDYDRCVETVGYRLQTGKTLKTYGPVHADLAEQAEGGVVIHKGSRVNSIGGFARNGVFLNFGKASQIGVGAVRGVGLNFGTVKDMMAIFSGTGVWLNYGKTENLGPYSAGGVFMSNDPEMFYTMADGWQMALERDETLKRLFKEAETAGRAINIPEIERIAAAIEKDVAEKRALHLKEEGA